MNSSRKFLNPRRQLLKAELNAKRLPFCVGIPESKHIENIGGIVRTANAFLISEIVLDSNVYNKAAAAGADNWENIINTQDVLSYVQAQGYTTIALEQHPSSLSIWEFKFPLKTALIIGHEVKGMSDEMVRRCDYVIEIPQFGVVESLNVATAASIVMYEYCKQHASQRR